VAPGRAAAGATDFLRAPRRASRLNIPKVGSSVPKMGIPTTSRKRARRESSLADALFSTTQQRVLRLLFGQPDRSFYATEIIGLTGAGSGTVQRELGRLEQSGLMTVRRVGTQKPYQGNADSPLFDELVGISRKTVGLGEPLRNALAPLAPRIDAAFVYGSVAKKHPCSPRIRCPPKRVNSRQWQG
jgi:hypothetical protein